LQKGILAWSVVDLRRSASMSNKDLKHLQQNILPHCIVTFFHTRELKIANNKTPPTFTFVIKSNTQVELRRKLWKVKDDWWYTSKNYVHSCLVASNQLQRLKLKFHYDKIKNLHLLYIHLLYKVLKWAKFGEFHLKTESPQINLILTNIKHY